MASLRNLVEGAIKALLDDADLDATVYLGQSGATKETPAVIVRLVSAEEEPLQSGNYNGTVEVSVRSKAVSDPTDHDALCDAVRDVIWTDDLPGELMAQESGLHVFGHNTPHASECDVEEDCWVEKHTVELYCCAHEFPG